MSIELNIGEMVLDGIAPEHRDLILPELKKELARRAGLERLPRHIAPPPEGGLEVGPLDPPHIIATRLADHLLGQEPS